MGCQDCRHFYERKCYHPKVITTNTDPVTDITMQWPKYCGLVLKKRGNNPCRLKQIGGIPSYKAIEANNNKYIECLGCCGGKGNYYVKNTAWHRFTTGTVDTMSPLGAIVCLIIVVVIIYLITK